MVDPDVVKAVENIEKFLDNRNRQEKNEGRTLLDRIYFPFLVDIYASDLKILVDHINTQLMEQY